MSSDATHTDMTALFGGLAITTTTASLADAQDAIPGLLNDIVVTHVLRSEYFDDPADLARLPAVSRAMRDAVAATGLRFKELDEEKAVNLGCFSAVQRLQRQGRLSRQESLCVAAAMSGQLEELKALRGNGTPWDGGTCEGAARGGNLEVMQWAHANGAPWNEWTCMGAARGGHLEVLQWARANACPWNEYTCLAAAKGGYLEVLQWARANGCLWDKDEVTIIAAQHGHEAVLRALIQAGADVNKADDTGGTPLVVGAQNGHQAVVRALIQAGADVNKAGDNGWTPLLIAAQNGHQVVVRALIDLGANEG